MRPIVAAEWLLERHGDPLLRIADCRWYLGDPAAGPAAYDAGHIPGAVFVDLDRHLSADEGEGRHPLPNPSDFAATMGSLGIGDGHTVVAYDDRGGAVAARLWWMLTAIGHRQSAVLDGGWQAWLAAGGAASTDDAVLTPGRFTTDFVGWPGTIDRLHLERDLGRVDLVDVRAADRYRGEIEPVDPRAGHIPGARNLPCDGNLAGDGTFADPAVLAARYGPSNQGRVVYCGSGVTACHGILAMELAGLGRATLYPGSWSDWAAAGGAVEAGEPATADH